MFEINFDKRALKQIKKLSKNKNTKKIIKEKLNIIEKHGTKYSKLLDNKINLYEMKNKNPSLRIYYFLKGELIIIVEIHFKKSLLSQIKIINNIKNYIKNLSLFLYRALIFLPQ